jgi:hypothetical protein
MRRARLILNCDLTVLLTPVKTRVQMPELNAEERSSTSLNKKGAD